MCVLYNKNIKGLLTKRTGVIREGGGGEGGLIEKGSLKFELSGGPENKRQM